MAKSHFAIIILFAIVITSSRSHRRGLSLSQRKALAELASVSESKNFRDESMRESTERKTSGRSNYRDKQLYKSYDEFDNELKRLVHDNAPTFLRTATLPKEYSSFARQAEDETVEEEEYDDLICMKKVVYVNEIVYDEEIVCKHESHKLCWDVQISRWKTGMKKECTTNFQYTCETIMEQVPAEYVIEICNEPLTRNCNVTGERVCEMHEEQICEKLHHQFTVEEQEEDCKTVFVRVCNQMDDGSEMCQNVPKKECKVIDTTNNVLQPEMKCRMMKREVCGPEPCPIVKADMACREETKKLTKEVPKEDCTIEPQQECKNVSTLLPMLVWEQQCADVPNEVCSKKRVNPRRQERPIIRKWCEKKRGKLFVLNHGVPDADDTSKPRPILNVIDLKSGAVQCSRQLPSLARTDMNSGSFASNEETLLFCGGTAVEDQSIQPNCQFIDLDSDLQDPNSVQDGLAFQNTGASIAYLAEENAMMIIGGMDADGVYNADFVITDTTTFEEAERVPLGGDIPGSVNGCVVKIDDDKYFYTSFDVAQNDLDVNQIHVVIDRQGDPQVSSIGGPLPDDEQLYSAGQRPICGYVKTDEDGDGNKEGRIILVSGSGSTYSLDPASETPTWTNLDAILAFTDSSEIGGKAVSKGERVIVVRDDSDEVAIFEGDSMEWRLRHDIAVGVDQRIFVQAIDKLPEFCTAEAT